MNILIKGMTIEEFADYDHDGIGYLIGTGQAVEVPALHGPLVDGEDLWTILRIMTIDDQPTITEAEGEKE